MKRFIIFLLLIAVAGFVGYRLYEQKKAAAGAGAHGAFAMPVEAAVAVEKPLNVTLNTVGTLQANESADIKTEVAGQVKAVYFTEGAIVHEGDPLVELDDRIYAAEYKQAEANLKLAKQNYERAQSLSRTGAASQRTYDDAVATLRQAEAAFDLAKTKLEKSQIMAPFNGSVGLRKISPGDYLAIGSDIVTISDASVIKVDFSIPENNASLLRVGQEVELDLDAIPGRKFIGHVYAIDPKIDVNGRAIALRALVPNPDGALKPGYFARVFLVLGRKEKAVMIPESAIIPVGQDQFVYVVEEGKAKMVKVEPGIRFASEVEILSGVTAGQSVITAGQIKVHDGADVMVLNQPQPEPETVPAAAPAEPSPSEQPKEQPMEQHVAPKVEMPDMVEEPRQDVAPAAPPVPVGESAKPTKE